MTWRHVSAGARPYDAARAGTTGPSPLEMKTTAATLRVYERKHRGCDVLRVDDVALRLRGDAALRRRACWNDRAVSLRNEDHGRDATGLRAARI